MKFAKIALTATILFTATTAFAQITPADRIQAQQQLQQNEQKQENMIKYLGREYERKQREKKKPEVSVPPVPEGIVAKGKCFDIKTIALSGAETYRKKSVTASQNPTSTPAWISPRLTNSCTKSPIFTSKTAWSPRASQFRSRT
jgi:hemolysin activation/secretion protein